MARALAGLFWGFAAEHYPTWINRYGGKDRTMWLSIYNVAVCIWCGCGMGTQVRVMVPRQLLASVGVV